MARHRKLSPRDFLSATTEYRKSSDFTDTEVTALWNELRQYGRRMRRTTTASIDELATEVLAIFLEESKYLKNRDWISYLLMMHPANKDGIHITDKIRGHSVFVKKVELDSKTGEKLSFHILRASARQDTIRLAREVVEAISRLPKKMRDPVISRALGNTIIEYSEWSGVPLQAAMDNCENGLRAILRDQLATENDIRDRSPRFRDSRSALWATRDVRNP